jgi:hypothetical protein
VDIRFAWDADRYELFADGNGDRILVVPMEYDRIPGRNFHLEHLYVIVLESEMVVRLLVHRNDRRIFREKGQREKA